MPPTIGHILIGARQRSRSKRQKQNSPEPTVFRLCVGGGQRDPIIWAAPIEQATRSTAENAVIWHHKTVTVK